MYTLKAPFIPDTSGHEQDLRLDLMSPKPELAILRASYGNMSGGRSVDSMVYAFVDQCRSAKIPFGLYHYLTPNHIAEQADLLMGVWAKTGSNLPLIADVEVLLPASIGRAVWQNQVRTFLDLLELGTGRKPIIYTSGLYWPFLYDSNGNPPPWTDDYSLWLAWYPYEPDKFSAPAPSTLPKGWTRWGLWQYADDGRSNGHPANDLNIPSDWFAREFLGGEVTPPPPTGGSMYTGRIISTNGAKLRPGPNTNNTAIAAYPFDSAIEGDHIDQASLSVSQEWMHLTKINGVAVNGWMATRYNSVPIIQYSGSETPVPPPPAKTVIGMTVTSPAKVVITYSDGTSQTFP